MDWSMIFFAGMFFLMGLLLVFGFNSDVGWLVILIGSILVFYQLKNAYPEPVFADQSIAVFAFIGALILFFGAIFANNKRLSRK